MTPVELCKSALVVVREGVPLPFALRGLIVSDRCPLGTRDATLLPVLKAIVCYVEPFEKIANEDVVPRFLSFCSTLLESRSSQEDALSFALEFLGGTIDEVA